VTAEELRQEIYSRYCVGQVVNMRKRDVNTDKIIKRFKVTILGFYPYFVLTERNGFKESFTYADFISLTGAEKG
jgi:hypothetical protein